MVFRISLALVVLLSLVAGVAPVRFGEVTGAALAAVLAHAGWLYLLIVFLTLAFLAWLAFGPTGRLRIGGRDAEPQFSSPVWLAMLFAAGMGIGLVFWGAAEPVSHLVKPPEGLPPGTPQAARAAMRYTFFHWGLHPWAIYALMGLAIAWFQYNRSGRGLVSDLLQPLIGDRHLGWIGGVVNVVAVVATAIGVATTLGFGTMQISAGMTRVFGLPGGLGMQLAVIGVCFVLYMASSASGVDRGIKWLSTFNLALAGLLLVAVALLGPTGFIFETFTTSLGSYLDHLVEMSLTMTPFSGSTWVADWTIFYWAWWISWSPFVGAFIARVSYGRSVREFVLGVVVVPSLLGFAWFSTFGGAALWGQIFGGADMAGALANGYETVLFDMYAMLPWPGLLSALTILLLVIFFVTSADSAVLVLGSMSSEHAGDPTLARKFAWGVAIALIAAAMLVAGGLEALQALITVAALPFALLMVGVMVGLHRVLALEVLREKAEERRTRRAVADWIAREQQERGPGRGEGEGG
ncbi:MULTISPECIES: BCCT family transporter [unclassified Luteimonas]|uniref:BCCT family transporter n=1 Tax=unclassified Luteimonas TaxID=2629088 RepID=UPI0018F0E447|nr:MULTISPECIES: BCCT family transporter [unclassified Luteimonas]MBJ6978413.1 BCCT family transporter [Luteimonas sp. MC1895]MBJ6983309.1 BCCT family transporter [Luteimonas sp. MC1750]QQO06170.1 BCCT family transporter [Luteimonas sp. MC1750]